MHPLVTQLHFARSEFVRCLEGLSAEDAVRTLPPSNSISWIVGHLAGQENFLWCVLAQEVNPAPHLFELTGTGRPPGTPPLADMWAAWRTVTETADRYLLTIDDGEVERRFLREGKPSPENVGICLLRNIYHYWFHTGEAHGLRQQMGHGQLPQFVGNMQQVRFR